VYLCSAGAGSGLCGLDGAAPAQIPASGWRQTQIIRIKLNLLHRCQQLGTSVPEYNMFIWPIWTPVRPMVVCRPAGTGRCLISS